MWYQELLGRQSWTSLWNAYIVCTCGTIRPFEGQCLVCGQAKLDLEWTVIRSSDGTAHRVPPSFPGAEGRYEDYVYLEMLEREWLRPITDDDRFLTFAEGSRPSPRAIVVLVFWTYFETRLERLLRAAMRNLPNTITKDLLDRYSSVGARLDRLYQALFSSTYWADLKELGYPRVADLLQRVQRQRNKFAHGHPEAIDDSLVEEVVAMLKSEHESWIAVFNRRLSGFTT